MLGNICLRLLLTTFLAAALGGCNLWDDDDIPVDDTPTDPGPGGPAEITADNAARIARAVLGSFFADELIIPSYCEAYTCPEPAPANVTETPVLTATASVLEENTRDCTVAGTVKTITEIADPSTPLQTPGDLQTQIYDSCDFGIDNIINGRISLETLSFTGNFDLFIFEQIILAIYTDYSITLSNLSWASDPMRSLSLTYNGEIISTTIADDSKSDSDTFYEMLTQNLSDGRQIKLINLTATTISDPSVSTDSVTTIVGSISNSDFGFTGLLNIETLALKPLQRAPGESFPHAGTLRIIDDGGRFIDCVVLDNMNIRLSIDTDGDGEPDTPDQDYTWEALFFGNLRAT